MALRARQRSPVLERFPRQPQRGTEPPPRSQRLVSARFRLQPLPALPLQALWQRRALVLFLRQRWRSSPHLQPWRGLEQSRLRRLLSSPCQQRLPGSDRSRLLQPRATQPLCLRPRLEQAAFPLRPLRVMRRPSRPSWQARAPSLHPRPRERPRRPQRQRRASGRCHPRQLQELRPLCLRQWPVWEVFLRQRSLCRCSPCRPLQQELVLLLPPSRSGTQPRCQPQ